MQEFRTLIQLLRYLRSLTFVDQFQAILHIILQSYQTPFVRRIKRQSSDGNPAFKP